MPFNGSGIYEPVSAPDFPAIPLTTIRAAQYNAEILDIAQALGQCLTRTGEGPALANIPMGGFQLTGLGVPSAAGQALVFGQDATVANLAISGSGKRITGDFSNATFANRVMFQTSTPDAATNVAVIPNGTSTTAVLAVINNSNPANASRGSFVALSADIRLQSERTGAGTFLPMTFYTGGAERLRIDTAGNVSTTTASTTLASAGSLNFGAGGSSLAGSIYSDANWGMLLSAKTVAPSQADFMFRNASDVERFRMGAAGQFGIAGADYGTAGQVFTSGGASAAPSWQTVAAGLGVGQTWQNMIGSRSIGTTFTNSTGKAIEVAVCMYGTFNGSCSYNVTVSGILIGQFTTAASNGSAWAPQAETCIFIVPNGVSYVITNSNGTNTIVSWAELR